MKIPQQDTDLLPAWNSKSQAVLTDVRAGVLQCRLTDRASGRVHEPFLIESLSGEFTTDDARV
jgi:hypothetical protein